MATRKWAWTQGTHLHFKTGKATEIALLSFGKMLMEVKGQIIIQKICFMLVWQFKVALISVKI